MEHKEIISPNKKYSSFYSYLDKTIFITHLDTDKVICIKPNKYSYRYSNINIVFTNDSNNIILLPTRSDIVLLYDMEGNLTNTIKIHLYMKKQYMEFSIILSLFESNDTFICSTCSLNREEGDIIEDKRIITVNKDIFRMKEYYILTDNDILKESYSFFVDKIQMIEYNGEYILHGSDENSIYVFTPELNIIYSIIYDNIMYSYSILSYNISYDGKYILIFDSFDNNISLWDNGFLINQINIKKAFKVILSHDSNYILVKSETKRNNNIRKIDIYNIKFKLLCNFYIKEALISDIIINEKYQLSIINNNILELINSPLTLFQIFKETILENNTIFIPEEIFENIFKFFCFFNLS